MVTEPLYYSHPHHTRFYGTVTDCLSTARLQALPEFSSLRFPASVSLNESAPLFGLEFDRTLFYPEGGGQPGDRGVLEAAGRSSDSAAPFPLPDRAETADLLSDAPAPDSAAPSSSALVAEIFYTFKTGDRRIIHLSDRPVAVGTAFEGAIDPAFRSDFQQQHTAQHLLSAVLYRSLHLNTLSIHLGESLSTIEIDSPPLSAFQLCLLQESVNHLTAKGLPIVSQTVDPNRCDFSLLRRQPAKFYPELRIVSIGDYDRAPCGGVHLTRTSQAAPIFVLDAEKTPHGCRLAFVAGKRALDFFSDRYRLLKTLSAALSVPVADLAGEFPRRMEDFHAKTEAAEVVNRLLRTKWLEHLQQEATPVIDLRSDSAPDLQPLANAMAKQLSKKQKTSLFLFNRKAAVHFILLDFTGQNLFLRLQQALPEKKITGGGRSPRFEGWIETDSVDYLLRMIRSAK